MSSFVATIILVVRDFVLCSTEHSLLVVPRARSHFESFFLLFSTICFLSFFLLFLFLFCLVLFCFFGGEGVGGEVDKTLLPETEVRIAGLSFQTAEKPWELADIA